jgi:hypothetical protein
MIRSGRLAQQAGIERFVEGKTDAAGRFEFTRIPKDLEVELVWWGAGIAPGWSDHLEQFEEKDRTSIEIELPAPAIIKATIDLKAFPEISRISLRSRDSGSEERHVLLKPGQKSFEIADLAPGAYTVLVMGPNERIGGRFPDAFTSKPLTQIAVTLAAGETRELEIGSP